MNLDETGNLKDKNLNCSISGETADSHNQQKNVVVDLDLGKAVINIMVQIYQENRSLVKMHGNPDKKLFGWIGDVFYPTPQMRYNKEDLLERIPCKDRQEVSMKSSRNCELYFERRNIYETFTGLFDDS